MTLPVLIKVAVRHELGIFLLFELNLLVDRIGTADEQSCLLLPMLLLVREYCFHVAAVNEVALLNVLGGLTSALNTLCYHLVGLLVVLLFLVLDFFDRLVHVRVVVR